ncbi:transposase, partial [Klebsiella michiganensis]|nr:transposase [Klebsiella michiganensis]
LAETLAVRAIENGTERIEVGDLDADDLVLPSVSMKALAQRRGRGRAKAAVA